MRVNLLIQINIIVMYKYLFKNEWIDLALLLIFLIPITIIDIKHRRIPNVYILIGLALFFIKRVIEREFPIYLVFLNAIFGFSFIFILYYFSKGRIGIGDAKLSALLSLALGLKGWIFSIFIASFAGIIFALVMIRFGRMNKEGRIPFAPFVAAGGLINFFLKDVIHYPW